MQGLREKSTGKVGTTRRYRIRVQRKQTFACVTAPKFDQITCELRKSGWRRGGDRPEGSRNRSRIVGGSRKRASPRLYSDATGRFGYREEDASSSWLSVCSLAANLVGVSRNSFQASWICWVGPFRDSPSRNPLSGLCSQ